MAYDFQLKCHRKVIWLSALLLASVLVIQYFELPCRDSMFSLLSTGKAYLSFNGWSKQDNVEIKEKQWSSKNKSFSALVNFTEMDHIIRPAVISTPEINVWSSSENVTIAASPVESDESISPVVSPTHSIWPAYKGIAHVNEEAVHSRNLEKPNVSRVPPDGNEKAVNSMNSEKPKISRVPSDRNEEGVDSKNLKEPKISCDPSVGNEKAANSKNLKKPVISPLNKMPERPADSVVTINEMNSMLLHSRISSFSKRPLWPLVVDEELADARLQIEHATVMTRHPDLYAPVYRNVSMFASLTNLESECRSYEMMERKLKVYVYKDGNGPVFHQPRLRGIYASEGWFMKLLKASNQFVTTNPTEAQLFYFPFSSQLLGEVVYVPNSHRFDEIIRYMKNYLDTIKASYPFWNRTDGADHFLVACHDWGPVETRKLMANCIRALCNSDVKEGFQFGKDVSLPETYIHSPQNPMREIGGSPPSKRKFLAFFAGQMHGNVRPILLHHWENKDPNMKIVGRMQKGYSWHMKNSKYCICAKGYEVNSPRVVEAILYGCVPVIISDNFVPPFFEILNWESFAVFVLEKDIPNLKDILLSISNRRYSVMQHRVKQVRNHFRWHTTPVKYDIFHMILHSIWYNRVFRLLPG